MEELIQSGFRGLRVDLRNDVNAIGGQEVYIVDWACNIRRIPANYLRAYEHRTKNSKIKRKKGADPLEGVLLVLEGCMSAFLIHHTEIDYSSLSDESRKAIKTPQAAYMDKIMSNGSHLSDEYFKKESTNSILMIAGDTPRADAFAPVYAAIGGKDENLISTLTASCLAKPRIHKILSQAVKDADIVKSYQAHINEDNTPFHRHDHKKPN